MKLGILLLNLLAWSMLATSSSRYVADELIVKKIESSIEAFSLDCDREILDQGQWWHPLLRQIDCSTCVAHTLAQATILTKLAFLRVLLGGKDRPDWAVQTAGHDGVFDTQDDVNNWDDNKPWHIISNPEVQDFSLYSVAMILPLLVFFVFLMIKRKKLGKFAFNE